MKHGSMINIYICNGIRNKRHSVCFWMNRSGCICCLKQAGTSTQLQSRLYDSTAEADFNSRSAETVTRAAAQRNRVPPGLLVGQAQLPASLLGEQ